MVAGGRQRRLYRGADRLWPLGILDQTPDVAMKPRSSAERSRYQELSGLPQSPQIREPSHHKKSPDAIVPGLGRFNVQRIVSGASVPHPQPWRPVLHRPERHKQEPCTTEPPPCSSFPPAPDGRSSAARSRSWFPSLAGARSGSWSPSACSRPGGRWCKALCECKPVAACCRRCKALVW